ncbi:FecR family protein [Flavobacteriaceae bacterium MAR_2010_72]|nr:FecR family protein [Flavobacteriaceae bacterium MAR_2010_72]TVZ58139.1 FecR family protein [Flavobacteriaceae bacterium MAR_2010_105]
MNQDDLLKKWLNNTLSEAEETAFKQQSDYTINLDILESARYFKASDVSSVDDFNTFKQQYLERKSVAGNKRLWWSPIIKIAAVFVVALGIYFSFFYNNLVQVQTLASQKTTIELPDHSSVALNALSKLEFSKRKWKDQRLVNLDGEAFFSVSKGKTFSVLTTDGRVTVIGTKFNVKQRENYFEVTCFEGVVEVISNKIKRQLLSGETFKVLNGKLVQEKTTLQVPTWTEGKSVFDAAPYEEVIAELERQYNIDIEYQNLNTNRLFTGGFTHNNLENALISITKPMNLTYSINSSNLVILYEDNK